MSSLPHLSATDVLRQGAPILVVEDEPFIAMDVAMAIEDAGGEVIGPAGSLAEAFALLRTSSVAGAILDVNLPDGDISPIVEQLIAQQVPFVIQTGVGLPEAIAARFPGLVVLIKPVLAPALVRRLADLMDELQVV
jgi:DNA-binding response OmpR family regulator